MPGMPTRAEATRLTRVALLDAGLAVAEQQGLSGLSVNRVVAEAGLGKGTFYVHFPDRDAYVIALHQTFIERILAAVRSTQSETPPGLARLRRATETYLDACLRAPGVRAFLFEARAEPGIADEVAVANDQFAELVTPDLDVMGWRHPDRAARLAVSMAAEQALLELRRGGRDTQGRQVLWRLLEQADLSAR
jgi:TetR/AcrR family transcriptional repressor of nem operon